MQLRIGKAAPPQPKANPLPAREDCGEEDALVGVVFHVDYLRRQINRLRKR